ncbi:MAG: hypothetical protein Q8Q38_00025 [bacterium]|nr:hypothetical protein [bacterium]MDZ4231782.1 hypothetical protein [Candidatus Pacearchaeota archaeon]
METPIVEEWTSRDGFLAYRIRHPSGKRELMVTTHDLSLPPDRLTSIKNRIEREVMGIAIS